MFNISNQRTYHVSRAFDRDECEVIHIIRSNIASNLQSHRVTQTLFGAHPHMHAALHKTSLHVQWNPDYLDPAVSMMPASDTR